MNWTVLVRMVIPGMTLWMANMMSARDAAPLGDRITLNGTWDRGGAVPNYQGDRFDRRTYQRHVSVPTAWAGKHIEWTGKHIELEFFHFGDAPHSAR